MMERAKRWARGLALASGLLAAAVLAGCGAAKGAEDEGLAVSLAPEALRQIVEEDNAHGRTVMWQLPEQREIAVEWRENGGAQGSVPAVSSLLKGNQGQPDRYIYTARLTGLAPGRTYEYRLRAGDSISRWHPLKTDGGGPFSALIFPDSQSADYDVWAATAKAGLAKEPDADFFISMGDLVDNGQDERQWQAWLQASAPLLDRMPAAPVMGNHEAYSLDWKLAPPERYLAHFSLPDNGVPGAEGLYYSFDWGPVHFSVVNTQMQELAEEHPDLLEKQRAWLEEDMRKTDKNGRSCSCTKIRCSTASPGGRREKKDSLRKGRLLCRFSTGSARTRSFPRISILTGTAGTSMISGETRRGLSTFFPAWRATCGIRISGRITPWM